jgi:hypothetical protein
MRMDRRQVLTTTVAASGALIVGRPGVASAADSTDPVPVPLDDLFDNNGIGVAAGDANLDGSGYGFPAAGLPAGAVTVDGVPYRLAASTAAGQNDNVVAWGQTVTVPAGQYVAGFLLAASTYGSAGGTVSERSPLAVTVSADGVYTVVPVSIQVLAPGEQARVEVGIDSPRLPAGAPVDAEVRVAGRGVRSTVAFAIADPRQRPDHHARITVPIALDQKPHRRHHDRRARRPRGRQPRLDLQSKRAVLTGAPGDPGVGRRPVHAAATLLKHQIMSRRRLDRPSEQATPKRNWRAPDLGPMPAVR